MRAGHSGSGARQMRHGCYQAELYRGPPGARVAMAAQRRGSVARLAGPCCDQIRCGGSIDQPRSIAETSIIKRFPVSCAGGGDGMSMLFFGIRPSSPDHTCTRSHRTLH